MISIIVTAYKEPKTIGRAINSLLENRLPNQYEVLVLAPDNETLNEAGKIAKNNKKIRIIKDRGEGKPAALNLAFKKVRGNIIVLTDGDVFVDKEAIPRLLEKFEDKKVGAVGARPVSLNSKDNKFGFWSHLLTNVADLRRRRAVRNNKRFFCSGYLFAMRSGIVKEIPEETLSDDGLMSYMVYKAGYKIEYLPDSKVYVKYPTNFKDWISQKKRSAGGYSQIKKWTGQDIRSFLSESFGAGDFFRGISNLREFLWLIELFIARIYLWMVIFKEINIQQKSHKAVWVRVSSTK